MTDDELLGHISEHPIISQLFKSYLMNEDYLLKAIKFTKTHEFLDEDEREDLIAAYRYCLNNFC